MAEHRGRGKVGTHLVVALRLVEAESCAPVGGVFVDIWHTDAYGRYSGFPGQGRMGRTRRGRRSCGGRR